VSGLFLYAIPIKAPGAYAPRRVFERVLELLRIELRAAMQQMGAPTVKHLVPAMVRRA
jgi:hypothetical protein